MSHAILQDTRSVWRHLRRTPWFAAAGVITIALGIGVNTAAWSVLHGLVFRPLAIPDPRGLIGVSGRSSEGQLRLTPITVVAELETGPLRDVCAYNGGGILATEIGSSATQAVVALVSGQCFAAFGVKPLLGRTIVDDDAPLTTRGRPVAVIGHRLWMRMFGADPSVIGRTMRIEGETLTVVGVMPAGFDGLNVDTGIDVFAPFDSVLPARSDRRPGASHILGRLPRHMPFEQAKAMLEGRWPVLLEAVVPDAVAAAERDALLAARPLVERVGVGVSTYRELYARPLTLVVGLTATLLLLACVNLSGLMLARLASRIPELTMRLALGGGRWRVGRLLVIEGLVLALAGTALSVPVALAIIAPLTSMIPAGLVERSLRLDPDARVWASTALVGLIAGLLMTSTPLWVAMRRLTPGLASGRFTAGGSAGRWAQLLLVAQVAMTVMLLASSGLLTRSLYLLSQNPLGIRSEGVVVVRVMPRPNAYRDLDNASYYPALVDRIAALPGVRAVGYSRLFPLLSMDVPGQAIGMVGEPVGTLRAVLDVASPGFFSAVGIPLVEGRLPTWSDTPQTVQVGVVSARLARMLAPDGRIVGRRVRYGSAAADQDVTIVGVVGDATMGNPRDAAMPVLYRPALQTGRMGNYPNLSIAITGDRVRVVAGVREALDAGGREYAHSVDLLADLLARAPASERLSASLALTVAALAAVLAGVGIYSVLAYQVSRRRREIGVRLAIGATPSQASRLIVGNGARLVAVGVALGLPMAWLAASTLRSLTFGISALDPMTLGVVIAMMMVLAWAASAVPARRAAAVDPTVLLRPE